MLFDAQEECYGNLARIGTEFDADAFPVGGYRHYESCAAGICRAARSYQWQVGDVDGMPDRIVLFPIGKIAFVELKAPGETMRPLQVRRKRQLEELGFSVYCIDDVSQIDGVMKEIGGDAQWSSYHMIISSMQLIL